MRFSIASLFFISMGFVFLAFWGFFSFVLSEVNSALYDSAPADAQTILDLLPSAFGVMCAIFFVTGIVLVFVLDSLADEPEIFWRR